MRTTKTSHWRAHLPRTIVIWLLVCYAGLVLPIERAFPFVAHWYGACALAALSFLVVHVVCVLIATRTAKGRERLQDATLLAITLLLCFVGVDVAFNVYTRVNADFFIDQERLFPERLNDYHVWDGELMPAFFASLEAGVRLYKPGQSRAAAVYGEHYYAELAKNERLRESVLEQYDVEFVIDRYGLRNVDEPASASIFALGDSFCFGYHTTQSLTFTEQLKARIGEPVYNMGISGTSPVEQVRLFEHFIGTYPTEFKPKHLLWLIFEGNDLEESVAAAGASQPPRAHSRGLLDGTIVAHAIEVPRRLRQQSVVYRLSQGGIVTRAASSRGGRTDHYRFEDLELVYPLYESPKFGLMLFRQAYVDRATQPESYVARHPNLPRLTQAFERMREIAEERSFKVLMVIVPSNARLYKEHFDDFPPITDRPYFIEYLKAAADRLNFAYLDLNERLRPFADEELLYFRDDTHFNPRGHELLADLLAAELAMSEPVATEL